MTIGARLKLIRKKNKLKLQEAGEIFDITAQTLSRYENGQRTPDNDFLEAFGRNFKLSGDWLLYGEPPIYRAADLDRDVKESFLELSHLIHSKEAPGIDIPKKLDITLQQLSDDIPENFLLLLKYMLKYPRVRQSIFQFFYLFQKPLIDEHPEIFEKVQS
jgi:transcriptional regulator with XRE-family HTH domain